MEWSVAPDTQLRLMRPDEDAQVSLHRLQSHLHLPKATTQISHHSLNADLRKKTSRKVCIAWFVLQAWTFRKRH